MLYTTQSPVQTQAHSGVPHRAHTLCPAVCAYTCVHPVYVVFVISPKHIVVMQSQHPHLVDKRVSSLTDSGTADGFTNASRFDPI